MAKNRFNTKPVDYTPRAEKPKADEIILIFEPCCVCGKQITDGYYGHWGSGGACSKTCDTVMESKPKEYPDGKLLSVT